MFHESSFVSKLSMVVHTYDHRNVEKCTGKTGWLHDILVIDNDQSLFQF